MCKDVLFQFLINLLRLRRASHDTGIEILRAASDAETPCLSLHSLADGDPVVKLVQKPLLPQQVQGVDEISVAGAAGGNFLDSIGYFQDSVPAGASFSARRT